MEWTFKGSKLQRVRCCCLAPSNTLDEISASNYATNIVEAFLKKISELVGWVSRGHTLIVIATAPFKAFSYTNKRLNIVLQLDQQEPFAGVAFEPATGEAGGVLRSSFHPRFDSARSERASILRDLELQDYCSSTKSIKITFRQRSACRRLQENWKWLRYFCSSVTEGRTRIDRQCSLF